MSLDTQTHDEPLSTTPARGNLPSASPPSSLSPCYCLMCEAAQDPRPPCLLLCCQLVLVHSVHKPVQGVCLARRSNSCELTWDVRKVQVADWDKREETLPRRSRAGTFALGTMLCRSSWLGACRERARLMPGRSAAMERIRGMTPTVETVTCRGAMPVGSAKGSDCQGQHDDGRVEGARHWRRGIRGDEWACVCH